MNIAYFLLCLVGGGLDQNVGVAQEAGSHTEYLFSFMNIYDSGKSDSAGSSKPSS